MGAPRHRLLQAALIALAGGGCAAQPPQPYSSPADGLNAATRTRMAANIGKRYWLHMTSAYICTKPPAASDDGILGGGDCLPTRTGNFTIKSVVPTRMFQWYEVSLDGGKIGYLKESDLIYADDEKAHAAVVVEQNICKNKGGVRVGMTRDQVYASCWGRPNSINKTTGPYGTHEQLVYGGGNYVYLENGVVSTIQNRER